jgi:hypothetical protein
VTPETTVPPSTNRETRDTIVVDLGRKSRKAIKRLRKGKGSLMDQVNHVLNELRAASAITGEVQPVVVVVTEREGSGKLGKGIPFFNMFRRMGS